MTSFDLFIGEQVFEFVNLSGQYKMMQWVLSFLSAAALGLEPGGFSPGPIPTHFCIYSPSFQLVEQSVPRSQGRVAC